MVVIDQNVVATLVSRILEAVRPAKIVLFGSRARGEESSASDVDLLVIAESDQPRYQRAVPIYTAIANLPVEADVLVYTPDEVREWSGVPQAVVTTALREGRVLYEKPN